jgi:condensin complex subunit 2
LQQAAAATPAKKAGFRLADLENASPRSNPRTPRRGASGDDDDDDDLVVVGSGVTPMKRVPILANFEEWMKMATDNKINATNSWNFALIDYFHDMSLLKDGDGVNFQRASCTLDGCVKIYTSRVDSVATETGKLLSGLADSNSKKKGKDGEAEGEESEEEEVDEDGNVVRRKVKKRVGQVPLMTIVHVANNRIATVIRSDSSPIICFVATKEIRHGICGRPVIQKGVC